MKIQQYMVKDVYSVNAKEGLNNAAKLMWENDCGALPVLGESREVIGMITDRDIAMAAYTKGFPIHELTVEHAMSNKVYGCMPDQELSNAEMIMQEHQVRRLPVIDTKNMLVGIISLNDIALAYKQSKGRDVKADEVAATLASVCSHRSVSSRGVAA